MKIGLVGLGKMGAQIAERLLKDGHQLVVIDPNPEAVKIAEQQGAVAATSRQGMTDNFKGQIVIWLMIPAQLVQSEFEAWMAILPIGSIIVDGGNSDFRDTKKRAEAADTKNIHLIDVGTSGGVLGLTHGFSMMLGGNESAFHTIEPVIKSLAQPEGYHYFGPAGSGHYVKMVHNAIEYGVMESYAEGYHLLHNGPYPDLDLSAVASVWQHGSIISSNLNDLAGVVLAENPELDGVDGYVAESGEARWALEAAQESNIALPAVQTALNVRIASQEGRVSFATKLLAAMRNQFGGHDINKKL